MLDLYFFWEADQDWLSYPLGWLRMWHCPPLLTLSDLNLWRLQLLCSCCSCLSVADLSRCDNVAVYTPSVLYCNLSVWSGSRNVGWSKRAAQVMHLVRLGLTSFLNGTASSVTVVWAGPSRLLESWHTRTPINPGAAATWAGPSRLLGSFTLAGILVLPSLSNGIPVVVGCSVSVPSVTTSTVVSLVRRPTGTA
jgi:hypothetical protein